MKDSGADDEHPWHSRYASNHVKPPKLTAARTAAYRYYFQSFGSQVLPARLGISQIKNQSLTISILSHSKWNQAFPWRRLILGDVRCAH